MEEEYQPIPAREPNNKFKFDFNIEINDEQEERLKKAGELFKTFSNPVSLLKDAGKHGIHGVKRVVIVLLLFVIVNIFFLIYSLEQIAVHDFSAINLFAPLLVLIVGIVFIIKAFRGAIDYLRREVIKALYTQLNFIVEKISNAIMDKVTPIIADRANTIKDKQLAPAINVAAIINENYKKMPRFLKKGLIRIISMVPIVGMVKDTYDQVMEHREALENEDDRKKLLYNKIDGHISNKILAENNIKWIWWMLLGNIVLTFLLITLIIGW